MTSMLDNVVNRQEMYNRVKDELDAKQGCQLQGYFQINRVPGNFHITTHAFGDIVMGLIMKGYIFDYTYTVNHVSFGKQEDLKIIQAKFANLGVLNPLDGLKTVPQFGDDNRPKQMQTNFYLIAVPSWFKDARGYNYNVY